MRHGAQPFLPVVWNGNWQGSAVGVKTRRHFIRLVHIGWESRRKLAPFHLIG